MPSRSMSAKEVRSTREKSWSGKRSPIAQAASRSAQVVCSMVATPFRRPAQKVSAALAEMKWWMRRQVSTSTWSLVTSGSSVARSCFARPFCRSPRSAAAYQAELSTKTLMACLTRGACRLRWLPRSCDPFQRRYRFPLTCRDRRRRQGRPVGATRPGLGQPGDVCIRPMKYQVPLRAHECGCATPSSAISGFAPSLCHHHAITLIKYQVGEH